MLLSDRQGVAVGVAVTVNSFQWRRSAPADSGRDGLFYLNNIPPGSYTLEVWVNRQGPPWIYPTSVYPRPFTDIAPIRLP